MTVVAFITFIPPVIIALINYGVTGEDITHNAVTIKTIPLTLKEKVDIEVRGEIYMSNASFLELNQKALANGEEGMVVKKKTAFYDILF